MNDAATMSATDIGTTIREAFPFEVDKFPLMGPDRIPTPHYGLFRSDNSNCVGIAVRKGYTPHTLDDVCALAEAASAAFGGTEEVRAHWNDGHFVTIAPTREWKRDVFRNRYSDSGEHQIKRDSDVVFPVLNIAASYDGNAFKANLGFHRVICQNTASIPVEGKTISANIRHSSNLRSRMDDLIEDMQRVVSATDNLFATIDNAQSRQVNMADFLREVYPLKDDASENIRGRHERRIEAIMIRLERERRQLGINGDIRQASAWMAYNAVQGFVQHEASRKNDPSRHQRMILALSDKAVERAAQLAFA